MDQTAPAVDTWAKGQLMTNEAVTRGQGPKTSKWLKRNDKIKMKITCKKINKNRKINLKWHKKN